MIDIEYKHDEENTFLACGIPKELFIGRSKIKSCLITIKDLVKNIEETQLFEQANLKISINDKIALI